MKISLNKICLLLIAISATQLLGCASDDAANATITSSGASSYAQGKPGGTYANTITLVATVTAIDYDKRTVTLKDDKGDNQTIAVGPEATNFPQIKVDDRLTIKMHEEVVVSVRDKNAATSDDNVAGMAAKAVDGSKPAALVANTMEVTGVVQSVDTDNHTATLKFKDGSVQTVPVRPDVVLSKKQVGKKVVIRVTSALALKIETVK